MRAIHVSVRAAIVRGALSHGDHWNCCCTYYIFVMLIIIIIIIIITIIIITIINFVFESSLYLTRLSSYDELTSGSRMGDILIVPCFLLVIGGFRKHEKPSVHFTDRRDTNVLLDSKCKLCRVMMCTLSSAHLQQVSKFSALRRFESLWTDCDKCAHQYNHNNYY